MDWIHCNNCFQQPSRSNSNPIKFFLTSCGHIFCERCNQSESSNKCRVCEAQYTTTVLSTQLREEVRDFFSDPETLLIKLTKVIQFQNSHRERFLAYLRRAHLKYDAAKQELHKANEEMKSNRKKIHALQQEVTWYKMQRDRLRSRMVPASPSSSSLPLTSPFALSPSDSRHGGGSSSMRSSGMGHSRLTMGFTNTTPRQSQDVSPLSLLGSSTPAFNPSQYRNQNIVTPESTPRRPAFGTASSNVSSLRSDFHHSSSQDIRRKQQPTPPTRGTPTDALKYLSLAFKNSNN